MRGRGGIQLAKLTEVPTIIEKASSKLLNRPVCDRSRKGHRTQWFRLSKEGIRTPHLTPLTDSVSKPAPSTQRHGNSQNVVKPMVRCGAGNNIAQTVFLF